MRLPSRDKNRLFRGQRGFTLIETVIAIVIISFIGTGVVKAIDTNARSVRVLDEKVQATNLVTSYLEGIRQLSYSDNASPYNTVSTSITPPPQYVVAMNIAYSPDGTAWFDTPAADRKLQKISITVSRTGGKVVLTTCTFRTTRTK